MKGEGLEVVYNDTLISRRQLGDSTEFSQEHSFDTQTNQYRAIPPVSAPTPQEETFLSFKQPRPGTRQLGTTLTV